MGEDYRIGRILSNREVNRRFSLTPLISRVQLFGTVIVLHVAQAFQEGDEVSEFLGVERALFVGKAS